MEKKDFGIGYIPMQMIRKGISNFDTIAEQMHIKKLSMQEEGSFSFDRYTKTGSNTFSTIFSPKEEDRDCILWCVNHYLGLNRHPQVIEAAKKALDVFGTGSGTSSMSGGRSALHLQLEERLARSLNKESVILYPTGYSANLGVLSALPGPKDLIIADEEVHASIRDGIKLSERKRLFFKHNDIQDLERLLSKYKGKFENTFVVVESVYSMSGDLALLSDIVELKRKYNFILYLDEAHAFGFYGKHGKGYAAEIGVLEDVDIFMSTFSKSTAAIGGFAALKARYKTYLYFRSTAYLFQASFSPATAAIINASLDIIETQPEYASRLHDNNCYMREKLNAMGFNLGRSSSPVIPIYISDIELLTKFNQDLYYAGIYTVTVIYPAVPVLEGRVRLIVSASHTKEQMDKTLEILKILANKYGIIKNQELSA